MTIDHPVRRLLARLCSADTMARIVDPTLADVRVEDGRLTWRGCLALMRALTLHAALSAPGALVRIYEDDDHAIPRAALLSLAGAFVVALPFVLLPMLGSLRSDLIGPVARVIPRSARTAEMFVLLVPQAMALTLPAAILLAFPVAFGGLATTPRIRRRATALLILYTVLTGVVIDRIMPRTNQAFRVLVSGQPVPRGSNETTFAGLRREMATLRTFHGADALLRRVEYTLHLRMALACAPFPLGLLALALSATRFGRRRRWLVASGGLACYLLVVPLLQVLALFLLRRTALPPALLAWSPMVAIGLLGVAILHGSSPSANESCA